MIINANNLNFNVTPAQNIKPSNTTTTSAMSQETKAPNVDTFVSQIFNPTIDWRMPISDKLSTEIDWEWVELSLCGKREVFTGELNSYFDYTNALYNNLKSQINDNFSGEKRAEQLQMLSDTFDRAIDTFTNYYMRAVGGTFRHMGADLPQNDIKDSIRGIFMQSGDTAFSANDLTALTLVTKVCSQFTMFNNGILNSGEEKIGLHLAMKHIATMSISNKLEVSDKMLDIITNFVNSYSEKLIDTREKALNLYLNTTYHDRTQDTPIDRDSIYSIINAAKEVFSNTKDAVLTLQEISALAFKQFKVNSMSNNSQRFKHDADFWNNFYDNGSGKSVMSGLLEKWNDFSTALEKGDYRRIF
jgi:hypothetical protein